MRTCASRFLRLKAAINEVSFIDSSLSIAVISSIISLSLVSISTFNKTLRYDGLAIKTSRKKGDKVITELIKSICVPLSEMMETSDSKPSFLACSSMSFNHWEPLLSRGHKERSCVFKKACFVCAPLKSILLSFLLLYTFKIVITYEKRKVKKNIFKEITK